MLMLSRSHVDVEHVDIEVTWQHALLITIL